MRKKFIAGNWKMNKTPDEAGQLADAILPLIKTARCDVAFCVPAIDIPAVWDALMESPVPLNTQVMLGAQNLHWAASGAYTGEISAGMLKAAGVHCVVIGHSERRQYFAETDEWVSMKTKAALAEGLLPIICVGEVKEERLTGKTDEVVTRQTRAALDGLTPDAVSKLVIAYEPVWAIGTGLTATDDQARETIAVIRQCIRDTFGEEAADNIRILYGGSMNEKNAAGLLAQDGIDGGLIGGASLQADKFAAIVNAAG